MLGHTIGMIAGGIGPRWDAKGMVAVGMQMRHFWNSPISQAASTLVSLNVEDPAEWVRSSNFDLPNSIACAFSARV